MTQIGKLLDLGSPEVVTGDSLAYLAVTGLDPGGIEIGVFDNFHKSMGTSRKTAIFAYLHVCIGNGQYSSN